MANSGLDLIFLQNALLAFQNTLIPVQSFSYATNTVAASLGDTITVPYVNAATSSAAFSYATGYTTDSADITGLPCVLDKLSYQKISLTDSDFAKLSGTAFERVATSLGNRLAGDILSQSFSILINSANYPLSNSFAQSNLSSSATLVELGKQADILKWPTERSLILSPAAHAHLMNNPNIANAYAYGSGLGIQTGTVPNVFGFGINKISTNIPTSFAVSPSAILMAFSEHRDRGDVGGVVDWESATDKDGFVLTMRTWYDPLFATQRKVVECLWGARVGIPEGIIQLKL